MTTRWNGEMACLVDVPYTQWAPGNEGSDELKPPTLQCWGEKKWHFFITEKRKLCEEKGELEI